jgi:hypothetical protein
MQMKKVSIFVAAALVMGVSASAYALPPFSAGFKAKYVDGNSNADFVAAVDAAKCNVCHDANSKSKKDKNEYGKAIGTILSKAKYEELKTDKEAAEKWIAEGLTKGESLKAASGKTFGEQIKAGMLPGS